MKFNMLPFLIKLENRHMMMSHKLYLYDLQCMQNVDVICKINLISLGFTHFQFLLLLQVRGLEGCAPLEGSKGNTLNIGVGVL